MSVSLMALVQTLRLPPHQKLIALALADQANDDGENVMPSVAKLAAVTGLSWRQQSAALAKLRTAGHLRQTLFAGSLDRYRLQPVAPIAPGGPPCAN